MSKKEDDDMVVCGLPFEHDEVGHWGYERGALSVYLERRGGSGFPKRRQWGVRSYIRTDGDTHGGDLVEGATAEEAVSRALVATRKKLVRLGRTVLKTLKNLPAVSAE